MAQEFRPLDMDGIPPEKQMYSWRDIVQKPYDKDGVDCYTRTRVILMNGIEANATIMAHAIARMTPDEEVRKQLALLRRLDSMQQQLVEWLNPPDATFLETTIGYEQVAVDLTANLAQHESDPYFKQVLDFALLEDFDHLFRYGCMLQLYEDMDPNLITQGNTEIKPGRATMDEHRHPFDEMRNHWEKASADVKTKMNYYTIVSAEQQTMNFYKNHGSMAYDDLGRRVYSEIADVEQQHVTQYESVGDGSATPLEQMALMELCEAYNYFSAYETETDERFKRIWERLCAEEIGHFNAACQLLERVEGTSVEELMGGATTIPDLVVFQPNKEYVNKILESTVDWRPVNKEFVPLSKVPGDWPSNEWNRAQNADGSPTEDVTGMAEQQGRVPEVARQMVRL